MTYYGGKELADSFRTVRKNTLVIAEEIPEAQFYHSWNSLDWQAGIEREEIMSVASETLTAPPSARRRPFSLGRLAWVAPAAGAVAGTLNMGVYAVAAAVGVVFLMPPTGGGVLEPLPVMMPLVASVVYAGIAGLVLAGLNRFTNNPVRNFLIVVPIAFVLSFVPLLTLPAGVALSTKLALGAMHFVAVPIITAGLLLIGKRKDS